MKSIRFFAFIAFCAFFMRQPLHAQTLRISGTEWPPYFHVEDGVPQGFFPSLYAEIQRRTGIVIKIVPLPQKRMLLYFRDRMVDAESFTNPAWRGGDSGISVYTVPVMESVDVVLTLRGKAFSASEAGDFKGRIIGCNLGYYYGEGFNEAFLSKRVIRDDSPGTEACLKKLLAGRVDAVILDRLEAAYVMRKMGVESKEFSTVYTFRNVSPLSLRLHTSRSDMIPKLNAAIMSMRADGFVDALLRSYLKR